MRKTTLAVLMFSVLGLSACGGGSSSSSQTTTESTQVSTVSGGGTTKEYTAVPMQIQVNFAEQLPADFPVDQLFEVAVNFDVNNSGSVDEGDIQVRLKRMGSGWTNATSNLYYIFVQDGGNTVVFDEATSFKSEGGRITHLGVTQVGTIAQTDAMSKTTLTFDLVLNPQRSVNGDLNGSDAVYTAFEQALGQINQTTPVNAIVGLADQSTSPASTVSYDEVPDGGTYFQGSNSSIDDNTTDYSGVSGEADIEKLSISF
ncbi:hypothetical protein [Photobacterium sp. 1_MG-2023]|uniref:hypothetical protein n=1 Tax=Photobacterium sp. 1_MG-2023 TaxID=3062646 RepID=UPI0026E272AE|nr:hypothetical protein [Photobacterium sp. 1_MG-2023]MDO6705402.1 hypothetical protein [Photobacterium sp. 1_MG-2023]